MWGKFQKLTIKEKKDECKDYNYNLYTMEMEYFLILQDIITDIDISLICKNLC